LCRLPYRRIHYLQLSRLLSDPLPTIRPGIPLEVRPFEQSDLQAVSNEYLPSEAKLCEKRMERGHFGFVACHNGRFLGCAWACTDCSLERVVLPFDAGDILFNDAFTVPAYRGRGVQTSLLVARLHFSRESGYRRAVAYAEISNLPSIKAWLKVGGSVTGHIRLTRVFNWRRSSFRSGSCGQNTFVPFSKGLGS
jgi:GNAT superfamily N-acetyltransferase